jgi:Flp pilus assembly CpaE family ATPase
MAINVAASLAQSGLETTLIDLDLDQGHVALYLNSKESAGLDQLASVPPRELPMRLTDQLVTYSDRLQLLLTHADGLESPVALTSQRLEALLPALAAPGNVLVVDCGHRITAVTRPILAQADQIVVCLRPERVALALAKHSLKHLADVAAPFAHIRVVIFDFTGQMNVPQTAIESFLEHPVTAVIAITPKEMNQAVNKSIPLVQLDPELKASLMIRQIARQLVKV